MKQTDQIKTHETDTSQRLRPSIPRGLRDILPLEASERREIENRLRQVFSKWAYGEVITPAFEFYEILATEAGEAIKKEMFRFFDRDGRQLALRPEMTTPIARLAAQRLDLSAGPQRLYYLAGVFREEPAQRGQQREFFQAGIELAGAGGPAADAEVIAIMVESLLAAGLCDFQVGIGQAGFFREVLKSLGIASLDQKRLETAASERNMVGLKSILDELSLDQKTKETVAAILSLRGGAEVLELADDLVPSRAASAALSDLRATFTYLKTLGLEDRLILDMGIIRGFDYYTGIIFEAYCPQLGFPLGGGGRYDNLISEFGPSAPAAGFAIGVERLHIALNEQGGFSLQEPETYLVFSERPERALAAAATLRAEGKIAEAVLDRCDSAGAKKIGAKKNINHLVEV